MEMIFVGVGIEPIGEMVLLAMENAPEKTESGLLLPEEARDKMNVGRVEAVGPERRASPSETESYSDSSAVRRWSGWAWTTC